jgi:hypothetical protein
MLISSSKKVDEMNDKTCCCGGGFVMQIETGRISKCDDGFSSLNLNWQIISMIV